MENVLDEEIEINKLYFELEYSDQEYKKSLKFKKWKEEYKSSHNGKIGSQYLCKKDNIVFIDEKNYPRSDCPKCGRSICVFCSSSEYRCCYKSKLKHYWDFTALKYIKDDEEFLCLFFIGLIPLLNLSLIYQKIGNNVEYALFDTKKNNNNNINNKKPDINCYMDTLMFTLPIPFIITYECFYLTLTIISLPFKLYPIKIYIGILDRYLSNY